MRVSSATAAILVGTVILDAVTGQDATLKLSADNVHWGFFSKLQTPVLNVTSGSTVQVEMATHHACDDWDKMIKGDEGMEDIFHWDGSIKNEPLRGAAGKGDGVHVLTGPIYVQDAEPGDLLKVEILDLKPRVNPATGKTYGSNAAAWWGYQARVEQVDGSIFNAGTFSETPGENDEVVTIYEVFDEGAGSGYASPVYQFRWPTLKDPNGEVRDYIQYPGTCVPHDDHGCFTISSDVAGMGWTKETPITYFDDMYRVKIPINYHVGCMGLAPDSHDYVDSIPPMPSGGNLDNKRIGVGTTMYYPVEVAGAYLSMGDAHTAQGDSELDGTGIETSITGTFKLTVIKQADFTPAQAALDFPLGETETEWIVHGFTETDYLETFSANPGEIYGASSVDKAAKNAYTQTRKFLMAQYNITEAEANSIITQGIDFGITQVVDGNFGVHAVIPKGIFIELDDSQTATGRDASRRLQDDADLKLNTTNVHWGFFSKTLDPVLTIESGDEIVVEMATHHACDDWDKMVKGDAGMEDIYMWTPEKQNEKPRGAKDGGDGVHILTGPIAVNGAEAGDLLKVEILDLQPRLNPNGRSYGSNAAAWWGFQARVPLANGDNFTAGDLTDTPNSNDEIVTIYELVNVEGRGYAMPVYQFEWPVITDPMNTTRNFIQYPGTCVPHDDHNTTTVSSDVTDMGWTKAAAITYYDDVFRARIPVNYHVGCMGLAPESHDFVDSIPPMPSGGNLDNKRIGVGTTMYYPVEVDGAMLSMGDAHTAQGDSELDGTGIETSVTGKFKVTVIKQADFTPMQASLDFPLGETGTHWMVHGFTETDYLDTYAENPSDIYGKSSLDSAMMNCYRQTRKFLMAEYDITEAEANSFMTQAVDFGVTQAVDGNWGIHALIPKKVFEEAERSSACDSTAEGGAGSESGAARVVAAWLAAGIALVAAFVF